MSVDMKVGSKSLSYYLSHYELHLYLSFIAKIKFQD